jgi:NADP oxidoreductase coenzyme F420-dependent
VVLSNSRGPETLAGTVAELGPRASAATSGEATAAGDIVVVTVPVKAFPNLPAVPLAGKTVIDTCNYGAERDGHIPELDGKSLTSSELLARADIDSTDLFALVASLAWLYDQPSLAQRADHIFGVISSAVLTSQAGSAVSEERPRARR